jgi:hypothetical protein
MLVLFCVEGGAVLTVGLGVACNLTLGNLFGGAAVLIIPDDGVELLFIGELDADGR